ncbi:ATP-binding protein involved in chromosome partitioning [Pullulanibacillus pueri]|uniref:Iron-sulfur cluster carrier protein n=1 Tax=Pullulanibacillus pueri TaxID=1437324 RepID=A0A8J3ENJ2_9BACL|nr:P-loop NTPase [Pullulanibacillus pueri]MBM7681019.1 ATP-binding protein involved in chromosome partitioning [Pullulanibacillus pueri]GGH86317.1 iron-sulfur cluster carrier protein [Pullulanibacillus pueri]
MISKEMLIHALSTVKDPDFQKNIIALDMINTIQMNETTVSLNIKLAMPNDLSKDKIEKEIKRVLSSIGVPHVSVTFTAMSSEERQSLTQQLKASMTTPSGLPKLLRPESGVTFLAITSGKGGVGKSTVTINLATAMARMGLKVGILDADLYGYSIPNMMGIQQKPIQIDHMTLPVYSHGIKVMSIGLFATENQSITWRGPMLNKWIKNFIVNTFWGELDYLLIDLPPGTGDIAIDIATLIPQAKELIVTTPHSVASHVATRAGAMARHTKHDILGVIENMAYYREKDGSKNFLFGKGGAEKLAFKLQTEVIARIPFGKPEESLTASVYDEDTYIGEVFQSLAQDVIYRTKMRTQDDKEQNTNK